VVDEWSRDQERGGNTTLSQAACYDSRGQLEPPKQRERGASLGGGTRHRVGQETPMPKPLLGQAEAGSVHCEDPVVAGLDACTVNTVATA